ncbi:MAG TPA: hypothetical protein PKN48_00360 [Bacteroidales bacterium]|nr:hypothetical protein [Bacteroidales bacterium]
MKEKKKLFVWCDFLVPTGFGQVADNLLDTMHEDFDVTILGINYHGDKKYDTSKYFVYPISKEDPLGTKKLAYLIKKDEPDILFLFQDIFHISDNIEGIKKIVKPSTKIVTYFPVDGAPFSKAWGNVFRLADVNITYSDWAIRTIAETFPKVTGLHKLYHGVNTNIYKPLTLEEIKTVRANFKWTNKFTVINVNRFQPRKSIPHTLRAFNLFAKGYKKCKCGNVYPYHKSYCDLNMCGPEDIIEKEKRYRTDVLLYLHMMANEPSMGPGRVNTLQNHLLNTGFEDEDIAAGMLGINAANIYAGQVPNTFVNELYNGANINISSSLGEGKLLEGTLILTSDGYISIENVTDETLVLNAKGKFTKVNKTLGTKFTDPMYSIKLSKFSEPIIASHDHPFLLETGEYTKAEALKVGDYVSFAIPKYTEEAITIDLAKYVSDCFEVQDNFLVSKKTTDKKQFARFLKVTPELCKFFGLYIAEGSAGASVQFCFHTRETELQQFIIDIYSKYFNTNNDYIIPKFVPDYRGGNFGSIYFAGAALKNFLQESFGHSSKTKKIPAWANNLSVQCRKALLEGIVLGDGNTDNHRHKIRITTSSPLLAYGIRDLYLSLGKVPSICFQSNQLGYGNGFVYKIDLYEDRNGDESLGQFTKTYKIREDYVDLKVLSIILIEPKGIGYDLEVPDGESYTIAQCTVHNCGLSLIESMAAGTPSIAPKNSAIPEMLGETGHLIPNSALLNQAMDSGHMRPIVDVWEMVQALEIEYQKWKTLGVEKTIDQTCIDRVNRHFLWADKVRFLKDIFHQQLND